VAHTERALSIRTSRPSSGARWWPSTVRASTTRSTGSPGTALPAQRRRRRKLEQAREIAHAIIRALDGDQLKATWAELQRIFRELEDESRER